MTKILSHSEDVAKAVIDKLGTPPSFSCIKANMVWENWYRVNIRVITDSNAMMPILKISDSFLVKFSNGILSTEIGDEIIRKY